MRTLQRRTYNRMLSKLGLPPIEELVGAKFLFQYESPAEGMVMLAGTIGEVKLTTSDSRGTFSVSLRLSVPAVVISREDQIVCIVHHLFQVCHGVAGDGRGWEAYARTDREMHPNLDRNSEPRDVIPGELQFL